MDGESGQGVEKERWIRREQRQRRERERGGYGGSRDRDERERACIMRNAQSKLATGG